MIARTKSSFSVNPIVEIDLMYMSPNKHCKLTTFRECKMCTGRAANLEAARRFKSDAAMARRSASEGKGATGTAFYRQVSGSEQDMDSSKSPNLRQALAKPGYGIDHLLRMRAVLHLVPAQ